MAEVKKTAEEIDEASKASQAGVAKRASEINAIKDEDEKKIVQLYEAGTQTYAIAKKVYKFVNNDTVGQVILVIRKHYADDYSEVEDVNSTKGYSGLR